jgi:hypothetical protein
MAVAENNAEESNKFSGDFTRRVYSNTFTSRMFGKIPVLGMRDNVLDVLTSAIPS